MSASDPQTPSTRPGVLIIGNFLSRSVGVRCVCEDLAEGLRSRGWCVLTASSAKSRSLRLLHMLATAWFKRARFCVAQIDLYADLAFVYAEIMAASLTILRCPYVLTLHGGALSTFAVHSPGRLRRLLRSAAAVTAPSAYHQEGLREFRSDIRVVRNGLDLRLYEARRLATARPRLVWLRAFHETYNPPLAVEVAHLLSPDFPDLHLLMIGPDKSDGSYQRTVGLIRDFGLEDLVSLVGAVPKTDVPSMLNQGDIFLNTTDIDNAPVTVVEALACGLCVVSTNVGGVPRLLCDGQDALLVPPRDAAAMAAAVRTIIADPSLAARLSANARTTAQAFDRETVLTAWETLLLEVSSRHRTAGCREARGGPRKARGGKALC
jgi:glycosyltransferase involved in cell wall biosynthesis